MLSDSYRRWRHQCCTRATHQFQRSLPLCSLRWLTEHQLPRLHGKLHRGFWHRCRDRRRPHHHSHSPKPRDGHWVPGYPVHARLHHWSALALGCHGRVPAEFPQDLPAARLSWYSCWLLGRYWRHCALHLHL